MDDGGAIQLFNNMDRLKEEQQFWRPFPVTHQGLVINVNSILSNNHRKHTIISTQQRAFRQIQSIVNLNINCIITKICYVQYC